MNPNEILAWLSSLGPYQTIGLLLLVAFYGPSTASWGWRPTLDVASPDSFLPSLLCTGIFFACLLTLSTNLSGPLRYGLLQYRGLILEKVQNNPNWCLALVFVYLVQPVSRAWLIAAVPMAWQYVREHHREAAEHINARADEAYADALAAASRAQEDAKAAEDDERQARDIAAVASRDARQAQALRETDYFYQSNHAWVPVQKVLAAAQAATEAAQSSQFSADEVQTELEDDGSDDGNDIVFGGGSKEQKMANLQYKLGILLSSAQKAEECASNALSRTVDCKDARQYVETMRTSERENGLRAAREAEKVSNAAIDASRAARLAVDQANETGRHSAKAKTEALKGDIAKANSYVAKAEQAMKASLSHAGNVATARKTARTHVKAVY